METLRLGHVLLKIKDVEAGKLHGLTVYHSVMTPPQHPSRDTLRLVRVLAHHRIEVVLDIGANTGQFARRLRAGGYRGHILSIEPLTEAHAALCEAASGDPLWSVLPRAAVTPDGQPVTLNVAPTSTMTSSLPLTKEAFRLLEDARPTGVETAEGISPDNALAAAQEMGSALMLKIDTQGTELALIDAFRSALDQVQLLQTELSLMPLYQGEPDWLHAIRLLEDIGFSPVLLIPGFFNRSTARLVGIDGVFAHKTR